jgi:hypothetical protein
MIVSLLLPDWMDMRMDRGKEEEILVGGGSVTSCRRIFRSAVQ